MFNLAVEQIARAADEDAIGVAIASEVD